MVCRQRVILYKINSHVSIVLLNPSLCVVVFKIVEIMPVIDSEEPRSALRTINYYIFPSLVLVGASSEEWLGSFRLILLPALQSQTVV